MMCVNTTCDAHANGEKELYLNFRWDKKSCSPNKLQFIPLYCVPLKEMIKKFHTQIQSLMIKFKTFLNLNQPINQYGSHLCSCLADFLSNLSVENIPESRKIDD